MYMYVSKWGVWHQAAAGGLPKSAGREKNNSGVSRNLANSYKNPGGNRSFPLQAFYSKMDFTMDCEF